MLKIFWVIIKGLDHSKVIGGVYVKDILNYLVQVSPTERSWLLIPTSKTSDDGGLTTGFVFKTSRYSFVFKKANYKFNS